MKSFEHRNTHICPLLLSPHVHKTNKFCQICPFTTLMLVLIFRIWKKQLFLFSSRPLFTYGTNVDKTTTLYSQDIYLDVKEVPWANYTLLLNY